MNPHEKFAVQFAVAAGIVYAALRLYDKGNDRKVPRRPLLASLAYSPLDHPGGDR